MVYVLLVVTVGNAPVLGQKFVSLYGPQIVNVLIPSPLNYRLRKSAEIFFHKLFARWINFAASVFFEELCCVRSLVANVLCNIMRAEKVDQNIITTRDSL